MTARILRELGYLVASRRHEGGPGDILAWTPQVPKGKGTSLVDVPPLLVEVKNTALPFSKLGPIQRRDLLMAEEDYGVEAMLCWWPRGFRHCFWVPTDDWPPTT